MIVTGLLLNLVISVGTLTALWFCLSLEKEIRPW